jgi:hypothetical protein
MTLLRGPRVAGKAFDRGAVRVASHGIRVEAVGFAAGLHISAGNQDGEGRQECSSTAVHFTKISRTRGYAAKKWVPGSRNLAPDKWRTS